MRNERMPGFIVATSLLLAMLLELLPLFQLFQGWVAPWLLVMVVFWSLHRPAILGIGVAWLTGLLLDAANATPLGTHALIFTLASALTLAARRLLLAFSVVQQVLWVVLMAFMQQGILAIISPYGIYSPSSVLSFVQTGTGSMLLWILLHLMRLRWLKACGNSVP